MMDSTFETARRRVNGMLLPMYQGKAVCIMGNVVEVDSSGMSFKLKASDNQIVNVQVQQPLQECLEGLLEVQGTVTPRNTVLCKNYIMFPKEAAPNFDMNLYNEAVQLMEKYPNFYVTSNN